MNNLNPHSRLASFYRYFYLKESLPNDLCTYFWKLLFAFVCFPLVWPAMLINRYNEKISLYHYDHNEYTRDGKWELISTEKRCKYNKQFGGIDTGVGALFTILIFVVGSIIGGMVIENCSTIVLDLKHILASLTLTNVLIVIYSVGLMAIFTAIALFMFFVDIARFIGKFKKKPTQEELDALQAKKDTEYEAMCERERYRMANPNFITLAWRWIVAFKEKNCPIITWDYTKKK